MKTSDILLSLVDIGAAYAKIFDRPSNLYHQPLEDYLNWRRKNRIEAKTAYYLKRAGYLKERRGKIQLTSKGHRLITSQMQRKIMPTKQKVWDNKWVGVTFEVPNVQRPSRDFLRRKLLRMGFYPIHRGFYIYPYPCLNEINFLAKSLKIDGCVYYLSDATINDDTEALRFFKKKKVI